MAAALLQGQEHRHISKRITSPSCTIEEVLLTRELDVVVGDVTVVAWEVDDVVVAAAMESAEAAPSLLQQLLLSPNTNGK